MGHNVPFRLSSRTSRAHALSWGPSRGGRVRVSGGSAHHSSASPRTDFLPSAAPLGSSPSPAPQNPSEFVRAVRSESIARPDLIWSATLRVSVRTWLDAQMGALAAAPTADDRRFDAATLADAMPARSAQISLSHAPFLAFRPDPRQ